MSLLNVPSVDFPLSVGLPIPCKASIKGAHGCRPACGFITSFRADGSTHPAPRQGHQTLPSRNAVKLACGSKQLFNEHAEFGKNGTAHLSRKVSKSSNWEVWGSACRGQFAVCLLLCRHFRAVPAVGIRLICWICEAFSLPFLFESSKDKAG